MDTKKNEAGNGTKSLLWEAAIESWLATVALGGFIITVIGSGSRLVAGACILVGAVLAMNGLMKTELLLTSRGPDSWKTLPLLRVFHHITNEGELAGISVGIAALTALIVWGEHIHVPWAEAFTLLGIMSAARLAVRHVAPVLWILERIGGIKFAIAGGSLLSSLTGEPAAAVFLVDYVKKRIQSDEDRNRAAVGLAAAIGSGGGLMPFAAPPILIIWGILQKELGWGIGSLIAWAGVGCVAHVVVSSISAGKAIKGAVLAEDIPRFQGLQSFNAIALLAATVIGSIFWSNHWIMWCWDIGVGAGAYVGAKRAFAGHEDHEAAFAAKWQPTILSGLLIALEFIGAVATPLVIWMGGGVTWFAGVFPGATGLLAVAIVMFLLTAWVSHVADNALASRAFIMVPITMMPTIGHSATSLLAAAVIAGALFGGFLTIPANLPNFPIARGLGVKAGPWLRAASRLYWTMLAYIGWIVVRFLML